MKCNAWVCPRKDRKTTLSKPLLSQHDCGHTPNHFLRSDPRADGILYDKRLGASPKIREKARSLPFNIVLGVLREQYYKGISKTVCE